MPAYEWQCRRCLHKIEVVTRVDDRDTPPNACHGCGATEWIRLPSAPSVQRGENWGSKGNWALLLIILSTISCGSSTDEQFLTWVKAAKNNPKSDICMHLDSQVVPDIKGRYCLRYAP